MSFSLQTRISRRKQSLEEYRLYKAGLEWSLIDPIVINDRDDLKSEYRWKGRVEPFNHQVTNLITFCRRLPITLLADDVGLGKTISAGLIMSELIARSRISKTLIVCPKLLGPQWEEELSTKFDIPAKVAIGRELVKADPGEHGAVITTYNSARLYLESLPQDRFQMLVLDEAHKLRNLYGTEKPPKVALCFRKALEERRFQYVLMLTATPIQNRLWDLYSLVDLLTVAQGHENPLGSEGMFVRKFIADKPKQARKLKLESQSEFRAIVSGYISRTRRDDAKLYFPERVVQMHKVNPTDAELRLIEVISKEIKNLNRLTHISILQALISSPDALKAQLDNMARSGSVSQRLASDVRNIVAKMPISAKLRGLEELINQLKQENPERWRLVVFTGRLETQVTIQNFLEEKGLKVGIINGTSGSRNQETIKRFKSNPPTCRVIVSTEAGSEGINLQAANVLVNYDLPWNPMIVEQRIGRIQRLASEYASVGIFNIVLRDTYEEDIVGRLMEKLQMAASAIGDLEALLEASGMDGDEDGFEEKIRQLVVAALQGKDTKEATRLEEKSILDAKNTLEREKEKIDEMLGEMDGIKYDGPRAPLLPSIVRSMELRDFTLAAFTGLGAFVTQQSSGTYLVQENGRTQLVYFDNDASANFQGTLYAPGTPAFLRLVNRVTSTGIHDVKDLDQNTVQRTEELARQWVSSFGGTPQTVTVNDVSRCFEGIALIRVRATVAHDSYERLVEIPCSPQEHFVQMGQSGLAPLPHKLENFAHFGINLDLLDNAARQDEAVSEFCRFYIERREEEVRAAGVDARKKKKMEDDFTPRLEMMLVAIEGNLYRQLSVQAKYTIDARGIYFTPLTFTPCREELTDAPELATCTKSGRTVPITCLDKCQISNGMVLQHLLIRSEISSRSALPEFTVVCSLSGKRILQDEAETSAVSGQLVANSLLKTSALSGLRAESNYFSLCEFTGTEVLQKELVVSEISKKRYRVDQQLCSTVSGKVGHRQEFILCYETRQPLIPSEAEQCEITGNKVRPAILEPCAFTRKRVLPSELSRCAATGKRVLRNLLVKSSLSDVFMLEKFAVCSATGQFCLPTEAKLCYWSERKCHPSDLRTCNLTGLAIHFEFITVDSSPCLHPLLELLSGIRRTTDESHLWSTISDKIAINLGKGRCRIESAVLFPNGRNLAICCEVKTLLGLKVNHVGLVYSIDNHSIIGRIAKGHRTSKGWSESKI